MELLRQGRVDATVNDKLTFLDYETTNSPTGLKIAAETDDAVNIGFDAKVAIHPKQVAVIRDAYAPTDEQVAWAEGLLAAAEGERGVFTYEGQMVDGPVFKQAQQILRRAEN